MARMMFGAGPEDLYLTPDDDGDLHQGGGVIIRMYSTETGNNPVTDLLDVNLSPISYITTSTGSDGRIPGQIAPFWGPDGTYELWAGADNQPRFLLQASNLGSQLGPIRDQYLQHAAQSNGHGTRLQDLANVNPTSVGGATDNQALTFDATSGLWVAETLAGGGGAPSNMVTTDTTQTVAGAKTTTGGLTVKPASVSTPGLIVQALASQTGNVEEWRDSSNAVKAWMTAAFALRVPNLTRTVSFARTGSVTTGVGTYRWYNETGVTLSILSVRIGVGTASSSGTPTVDVNKNGTTIYGTQANRPTVAVGSNVSSRNTSFSVTTIADGEYLTADIDVAGTGAADLWVQVEVA